MVEIYLVLQYTFSLLDMRMCFVYVNRCKFTLDVYLLVRNVVYFCPHAYNLEPYEFEFFSDSNQTGFVLRLNVRNCVYENHVPGVAC